MTGKHQFEITSSGFFVGAKGKPIALHQTILGRPETGIWSIEDEIAYEEHLTNQMWQILRISQKGNLPKNWEFTSDVYY